MAKVNGPLFSLEAAGQVGHAVVYSSWKGIAYVRKYVIPANPQSFAQRFTRAYVKFLGAKWSTLSAADQATYYATAAQRGITPSNAFVSENIARAGQGLGITQAIPAANTSPTTTVTSGSATGEALSNTFHFTAQLAAAGADVWAILCCMRPAGEAIGSAQTAIAIMTPNGTTPVSSPDFTLEDGDYDYNFIPVSKTGKLGTVTAGATLTLPIPAV